MRRGRLLLTTPSISLAVAVVVEVLVVVSATIAAVSITGTVVVVSPATESPNQAYTHLRKLFST